MLDVYPMVVPISTAGGGRLSSGAATVVLFVLLAPLAASLVYWAASNVISRIVDKPSMAADLFDASMFYIVVFCALVFVAFVVSLALIATGGDA